MICANIRYTQNAEKQTIKSLKEAVARAPHPIY
jgi:hypothetical protein